MQVKIDTKEKFHVLTPQTADLSANMAAAIQTAADGLLSHEVKNIVLNLQPIQSVDEESVNVLARLQQQFYEQHHSFVICCVQPAVEKVMDELELLEFMNITPTESEAWDIVQMEEIERELLDDDEPLFNDIEDQEK
jgi:anti-anti-sigma factor